MITPDSSSTLASWLCWLEDLHPSEIDLGLDRISKVAIACGLDSPNAVIVTVGGTNGKGSVVETLMQIYLAAGYQVGAYTSPHLVDFNERIRIAGTAVDDRAIVSALNRVELRRGDVSLTYFEFTTLAAMQIFTDSNLDIIILEVGLGGRLDAVNLWDSHCAAISSIGIDHESWLGCDREVIGAEKAAIARSGKPLIVGEIDPPNSLARVASGKGAVLLQIGRSFSVSADQNLTLFIESKPVQTFALPTMNGEHQLRNAAVSLMVVDSLNDRLPVATAACDRGLQEANLPGRIQVVEIQGIEVILDVAHNPAAAAELAKSIAQKWPAQRLHAVVSIMADKDIEGVVDKLSPLVSHWYCADLEIPRALPAANLAERISVRLKAESISSFADFNLQPDTLTDDNKPAVVDHFVSVEKALEAAMDSIKLTQARDREQFPIEKADKALILVFGSFFTVTEIVQ